MAGERPRGLKHIAHKQKIIARNRVNFIKAKYNLTPEQVQKMYDDQKGLLAS